jgi:hypothetical protein
VSVILLATTSQDQQQFQLVGKRTRTRHDRLQRLANRVAILALFNHQLPGHAAGHLRRFPPSTSPTYPLSPGGALPSPDTNAYVFDPTAAYQIASYDWIVSGGISLGNATYPNTAYVPSLGGKSPFIVESIIPTSFDFWQVQPSTAIPEPPDTYVGQFNITTNGTLTFVAGPPASEHRGHHARRETLATFPIPPWSVVTTRWYPPIRWARRFPSGRWSAGRSQETG